MPESTHFSAESLTPPELAGLRLGAGSTSIAEGLLEQAQASLARYHGMVFAEALEPAFLAMLQNACRQGSFVTEVSAPGRRTGEQTKRAGAAIQLALGRLPFLRWLEEVTQCGRLLHVNGRVVQSSPGTGEGLSWHDDLTEPRRLAIVLNLSDEPFSGGDFEMRYKDGKDVMLYHHEVPGSLLIFSVDAALEHRVLPVTAGGPRRVFAGWAFGEVTA